MLLRLSLATILCSFASFNGLIAETPPKAEAKKEEAPKVADKKVADNTKLSKTELITKLMKLMDVEKQFSGFVDQLLTSIPNQFEKAFGKDQEKFNRIFRDTMSKTLTEEMKKMHDSTLPSLTKLFETNFTQEDMVKLVDFYESPVGQKQQKLLPELMKITMNAIQSGFEKDMMKNIDNAIRNTLKEAKTQGVDPAKIDSILAQADAPQAAADKAGAADAEADESKTGE